MTWPVPPDTPILPMIARMRSFAVTASRSRPVTSIASVFGSTLQQALRREHMADFGRADAEGEGAERAVGRRVAVAADDGLAGLRRAELRTDDVDDAALLAAEAEQLDAELPAVLFHRLDLARRGFDLDRHAAEHFGGIGRRRVIQRRERAVRPPHLQSLRRAAARTPAAW